MRGAVKGMLLTEYNEAEQMELFREDGRKEGLAQGRAEGRAEGFLDALIRLAQKGLLSPADAAAQAEIPLPEFRRIMAGGDR